MAASVTMTSHIELDEHGRAWIANTRTKVIEIVAEHLAYGWSAETLHDQHPHLPLVKIYAALTWFYEHESEMLDELRKQDAEVARLRRESENSALQERLHQLKLRGG
jgi:uncharacterized protein (DUF433 family)